jgi:hypothetical protein
VYQSSNWRSILFWTVALCSSEEHIATKFRVEWHLQEACLHLLLVSYYCVFLFYSWWVETKSAWYCGHCLTYCTSCTWEMMNVEQSVEGELTGRVEILGDNLTSVPLCPPQTSNNLTRARNRAAAVGSRRLTIWAMARPFGLSYFLPWKWRRSVAPKRRVFSELHGNTTLKAVSLTVRTANCSDAALSQFSLRSLK